MEEERKKKKLKRKQREGTTSRNNTLTTCFPYNAFLVSLCCKDPKEYEPILQLLSSLDAILCYCLFIFANKFWVIGSVPSPFKVFYRKKKHVWLQQSKKVIKIFSESLLYKYYLFIFTCSERCYQMPLKKLVSEFH